LPEGHSGVHGIAASRIKDIFGRPTAFFAPKAGMQEMITGSVRGIEGFHVRDALQQVANDHPKLLIAFGGHAGAGGLTLKLDHFEQFSHAFEDAARIQLSPESIGPVILTDGALTAKDLTLELFQQLSILEPFGREFEPPIFEIEARLKQIRLVGDGTHARVVLQADRSTFAGIWFGMRQWSSLPMPVESDNKVKVAFTLKENHYMGNKSLDIQVVHMSCLEV